MYRVNSYSLISLEYWPSLVLGWLDLTICLMDQRLSWYGVLSLHDPCILWDEFS